MGLDNGLIVSCDDIQKFADSLPSFIHLPFAKSDLHEIAYWRKCWGLREEINAVLHNTDCECNVDKEDIPAILEIIKRYLNPKYWDQYSDSIWSWQDYFDHNVQMYINLQYLYDVWDSIPGIEVVWYDSY